MTKNEQKANSEGIDTYSKLQDVILAATTKEAWRRGVTLSMQ